MIHAYDRATIRALLHRDLDPALRRLLEQRIGSLTEDLIDHTEYLVVEPGDTEDDIVRHVGFSPLVEPIDDARFGEPGFAPTLWDYLTDHSGWYEMIVTFGSTFAYVLLIANLDGVPDNLRALCREFGGSS